MTELCNDLEIRGGIATLSSQQRVPASIGDAIARRVGGLGATVRKVIEQAAVLGEIFDLPALIASSETDLTATLAAIDSAEALGLIRPVHDSDGEFSFVHALTREAVVGGMAASQLRIMHARAAEAARGARRPIRMFPAWTTTAGAGAGLPRAGVAIRTSGGPDGRTESGL